LARQGFTFVDHTADIAVRLEGATLDDLFAAAAGALTAAMTDRDGVEPHATLTVRLEAADVELLLVDWLGELLYRFEVDRFLVRDARPRVIENRGRWVLTATVNGEPRDPARHPIKVLIKAVTYHGLKIERSELGYETLLVFDI
jgi:SHS2 domain-containing protein